MMFNIQFECNVQYNIYFRTKQFILFFYLEQNGKLSFEFYKRLYDRGHEPELASPLPTQPSNVCNIWWLQQISFKIEILMNFKVSF